MGRPIAYQGSILAIVYAVIRNSTSPGLMFYEALALRDQAKLNTLFRYLGEKGHIHNEEKFKRIEGTGFWEFKSFQIRMPCFRNGNLMIITHGFVKKKNAMDTQEIDRANRFKAEDSNLSD